LVDEELRGQRAAAMKYSQRSISLRSDSRTESRVPMEPIDVIDRD
jgi:hypothetical protein